MRAAAAVTQRAAALDAWARRAAPLLPGLFVVLWSTGFIAAKYGLPFAPPLEFLLVRFALVASLMMLVAFATRATWPRDRRQIAHIAVAAWLVHGVYLGGVFIAIAAGMPAGTSAMLVGLQPILTVFLARAWLGERISRLQWAGLVLGLVGVYFVVRHKIGLGGDATALVAVLAALVGISVGTLYQKKHCAHVDLRSGAVVQFSACALLYAAMVALAGWHPIDWTPQFLFALGWSVIVLSVGAISLLYWLLRHGAAADVARLFYLVPPVTALMAFALFGERLDALALAGMALIAVGVALARRR
ncbi:MAG TPA: DMT family transporter [Casimicrobiaceae bacterium]|nr:DMT family transporter [Casimicrobiaceae bacterium]